MKKTKLLLLFFLLFPATSVLAAAAELSLSQPSEVYNLGDMLKINFSILGSGSGLAKATLVCPADEEIFYVKYLDVTNSIAEKLELELSRSLGNLLGECYVEAEFANQNVKSPYFIISDKINVDLELEKKSFLPSENIHIKGSAIKANGEAAGEAAEGSAQISVAGIEQTVAINKGSFEAVITLPSNAAGTQEIKASVKEGENTGISSENIDVKRIPKELELAVNKENFMPKEKLQIMASIYDQAGKAIEENISIKLRDKDGKIVEENIITFNKTFEYIFPFFAVGDWEIEGYGAGLSKKRFVTIAEYEAIDINLTNNTLVVTNIGNVPYKKPLSIKFDSAGESKEEAKELSLDVGEQVAFALEAPQGTYNITTGIKNFSNVPLTGNVIGVIELKTKKPGKYPLASFLFFVALLAIITHLLMKKRVKGSATIPYSMEKHGQTSSASRHERYEQYIEQKTNFASKKEKTIEKYAKAVAVSDPLIYGQKQQITALVISPHAVHAIHGTQQEDYLRALLIAIEGFGGIPGREGNFALFNAHKQQQQHQLAAVQAALKIRDVA